MKNKHHSATVLLLVLAAFSSVVAGEPEDKGRIWETFAVHAYSNLNAAVNGELTPVFRSLGDLGELQQYFDQDRNPKKYEAYRQFIVQVFADAMRGDVGEAMFANVVLEMTPTRILLPMIAPEIGPQGRLHGIFDGKSSDVAKKIERRSQVIYEGNVNFNDYVSYLKGGKDRGYTTQANASIIVEHMFEIRPQLAFIAMLQVDYNFRPYSTTPYGCRKDEIPQVQALQVAYADISDYLYRSSYNMPKYAFPIPEGLEERTRLQLKRLARYDSWWVRLYVAHLLKSERMLRWSDVLDDVCKVHDPSIQSVMKSIQSEYPRFIREPNKAPEDTVRKLADPQR